MTETVRKLAQLAQQTGRELGIAPEILATRREMERLVAGARDGGAADRLAPRGHRRAPARRALACSALRPALAAASGSEHAIRRARDIVHRRIGIDGAQQSLRLIVLRQRAGLLLVDLEPPPTVASSSSRRCTSGG